MKNWTSKRGKEKRKKFPVLVAENSIENSFKSSLEHKKENSVINSYSHQKKEVILVEDINS